MLILASAMIFFDVAFFAAIAPLLPEYVDELGLSKAEAGILSAAYAAGTLLGSLPAGFVASRVGPKRTVIAGLLLLGCASFVFGFAKDIALLDGTFASASELPGRSMADIPHPLMPATRDLLKGTRAALWFVHVNHTNAEIGAKDVVRDGQRFALQ